MSLAATAANLLVIIEGKDMLTPAAASAEKSITSLGTATKTTGTTASTAEKAFGLVGNAATGMGNALNHAKGFVSNLVSGPLGMIGLGAAAFSVAGALKSGIDTANELAATLEKLHADHWAVGREPVGAGRCHRQVRHQPTARSSPSRRSPRRRSANWPTRCRARARTPISKLTALDKQYGITLSRQQRPCG